MRRLLIPLFLGSTIACAPIRPNLRYDAFGEAEPERDREIREGYWETTPSKDVKVLVDTLPEGIKYDEGNISVEEGFEHQLIGKFTLIGGYEAAGFMSLMRFPNYEDDWSEAYCYPQTVLTYLTLFTWSYLVPLAYPCWGSAQLDKEKVLAHAKRLATRAGGDLVILGYSQPVIGADNDEVFGAVGFVLRRDPRMQGEMKTKKQKVAPEKLNQTST